MTSTLLTAKQFTKMNKIELLSFILVRWEQGEIDRGVATSQ